MLNAKYKIMIVYCNTFTSTDSFVLSKSTIPYNSTCIFNTLTSANY